MTRRDLLKSSAATTLAGPLATLGTATMASNFLSILRQPDFIRAYDLDGNEVKVDIETVVEGDRLKISLQGKGAARLHFRWRGDLSKMKRFLGDHWERSYADLQWQGESPNRPMPWYFMVSDLKETHGYGVKTGAGALCFWTADAEGICLWADVRSGGVPVELGGRKLHVADVICREGKGESAFGATQAFCKQMCDNPRLPDRPLYGTNDWNYAYGNNSADLIATVSGLISELSTDANRPYSVIDEGWQMGPYNGRFGYGPWEGNPKFGDMGAFAQRLKGMGVRPGLWFRPLTPLPEHGDKWRLSRDHSYLDPTIPEVHEHVKSQMQKFVGWGYEMVKHDFSSWDFLGRWGTQMGSQPTQNGWRPADASKTTAEIFTDLYKTIRAGAGEARLIGCNTMGHLAAGYHELQRTGDDTSGRSWNRNRRMGVNTLAFRAPQHRSFFEVDPDIVSITKAVPWYLVEQWLRLVSESGVGLFVAIEPSVVEPKHREALKKALAIAAKPQIVGEPLDWMDSLCPRRWKLLGKKAEFNWMGESGAWPFPD